MHPQLTACMPISFTQWQHPGGARKIATSIALEVVLYFGWWYDVAFWLATIGLFIYKGAAL